MLRAWPINCTRTRTEGSFSSSVERIVACWDCGANWSGVLFKVDGGIPEMRVLNGIRVLSMGWVVLGHTYRLRAIVIWIVLLSFAKD